MATITRRHDSSGRRRYRVEIRLRGHPRLSRTFDRLGDARAWSQETEADLRRRRALPGAEARRRTLGEALDRYLEEVAPARYSGRELAGRRRHVGWWRDQLGHLLLADLTSHRIADARSHLEAGGGPSRRPITGATTNRYLASLSAALRIVCREWGWLERNPCSDVDRRRESRGRDRYLAREEAARLLEACAESSDPRLCPLVLLALTTGARRGELMRARWEHVDLSGGRWEIPETKSGRPRVVPLPSRAVEALRGVVRVLGVPWVWAGGRRGFERPPRFPRKAWEAARSAAGLEDVRFHDLRHTFCSWWVMAGGSLRELQDITGHRTLAMLSRYAHLSTEHLEEAANRTADELLG